MFPCLHVASPTRTLVCVHDVHINMSLPCPPAEPKTPVDPCDRVKFLLEKEEVDEEGGESHTGSHSLFTELEELRCDHHNKYIHVHGRARGWVYGCG